MLVMQGLPGLTGGPGRCLWCLWQWSDGGGLSAVGAALTRAAGDVHVLLKVRLEGGTMQKQAVSSRMKH